MWTSEEQVFRRRVAVERWKVQNRERYLKQKREFSSGPEYKAHRREQYHAKRQALIAAGFAPNKQGDQGYTPWKKRHKERGNDQESMQSVFVPRAMRTYLNLRKTPLKKQVKIDVGATIATDTGPVAHRNGIGIVLQNNQRFRRLMDAGGLTPAGQILFSEDR